MAKKHKLSHAEREKLAMARNELNRAVRVAAAQDREATKEVLRQAAVEEERAERQAAIDALPLKARELLLQQQHAMSVSRQRFNSMLAFAVGSSIVISQRKL